MKRKKKIIVAISTIFIVILLAIPFIKNGILLDSIGIHLENPFLKKVNVPNEYSKADNNNNGIADPIDIVNGARKEAKNKTPYKSNYYDGGYPPDNEGVCTDVIWRGLKQAGITLKTEMDKDIATNTKLYPRTDGKPDANIDFRRVPNQHVFFNRHLISLPTEIISGDINNLKQWQPGDIVVYRKDYDHVAIVSDKRTRDGIPYIIHNNPPFASEIKITSLANPIAGHYRWKF
ncbi:MAG: DUF1287 domain-containing protein [Bacillaceae bacterium]